MKTFVLLCILIIETKISCAQHDENPLPYVPREPEYDTAPRFPGGSSAMMLYFKDSIRYPSEEKSKGIQGDVLLKFDVSKKGKIKNVQLVNGVPGGPGLAKEAVRVTESMPLWIPATKKGKPVDANYFMAVPFMINRQSYIKKQ